MDAHSESPFRPRLRRNWWIWALAGLLARNRCRNGLVSLLLLPTGSGALGGYKAGGLSDHFTGSVKMAGPGACAENAALHFMEASYPLLPPESVSTNLTELLRSSSSLGQPPLAPGLLSCLAS